MAVDKNKIEFIYDEIAEVLQRSSISQETYNFLLNVKDKLDDLLYNDGEGLDELPKLMSLEKTKELGITHSSLTI